MTNCARSQRRRGGAKLRGKRRWVYPPLEKKVFNESAGDAQFKLTWMTNEKLHADREIKVEGHIRDQTKEKERGQSGPREGPTYDCRSDEKKGAPKIDFVNRIAEK